MSKKILAMLLAACMVLSMGTVAFAADDATCSHDKTTQVELRAPTCEKAGIDKVVCTKCGVTRGYVSTGLHNYVIDEILQPYACQPGTQIWKCADCDATKEVPVEKTKEHIPVAGTVDATCTTPEQEGKVCAVCGVALNVEDVEGSKALGHEWVYVRDEETFKKLGNI